MISRLIPIFFSLLFFSVLVFAQDTLVLSFDKCLEYAMEKNIDLKLYQNMERQAIIDRQQSQWNFAPSINGWSNTNFNFRRSTNQNNEISSGTSYHMGYGISGSLVVFDGLTRMNTIAAQKYNELAYREKTDQAANLLYFQLLDLYTDVLYQKSAITVAQERLGVSEKEMERVAAVIEAGQKEPVALIEMQATISGNRMELYRAINSQKLALLKLAQLVEIPTDTPFDILPGDFDIILPSPVPYTLTGVYAMACTNLPAIREKEYQLATSQKRLAISKGELLPNITLNGGYGSGSYSTDTLGNGQQTPFATQYRNYVNPSLGISLNVPIFNRSYRSFDIKRSKLNYENALIQLEKEKKSIREEIQNALQRLDAFRLEYMTASDNLMFVQKSYETYRERFQLGLITTTDFMMAQNMLSMAKLNLAAARYNWLLQEKYIKIYMGEKVVIK
jgi:outer membrane protein